MEEKLKKNIYEKKTHSILKSILYFFYIFSLLSYVHLPRLKLFSKS